MPYFKEQRLIILLVILSSILLVLPELTYTVYPPGISPDPDKITFENIIDGIFYLSGLLIAIRAVWYIKGLKPSP